MFDAEEHFDPFNNSRKKKKKNNNKRFCDEQIRSLESIFESESRLEPRKKLQLAKELGLQPRQVAIWFQNKRARWKSKQLERDFSVLRANYNSLASRFENLKKEKQALAVQLQKLNELIEKPSGGEKQEAEAANNSESEKTMERLEEESSVIKTEDYFGFEEEANLMSIAETGEGSLTSQEEDWGNLESDPLFDQSNNGGQWWDFWA